MTISIYGYLKNGKGELQKPVIGTLTHSCWLKIQRQVLDQYSIRTVGQYSVGANSIYSMQDNLIG